MMRLGISIELLKWITRTQIVGMHIGNDLDYKALKWANTTMNQNFFGGIYDYSQLGILVLAASKRRGEELKQQAVFELTA